MALLVGFALQKMGTKGTPILGAIRQIQALVFRILAMIMWVAPIGAFGAIAAVVGNTGVGAIFALGTLMVAFYITCALFIVVVLGSLLWAVARVNIFRMMKYLGREYLLIVSTSSSEVVLPRLIAKMEHAGVSKPVAGITIPTGLLVQPRRHGDLPHDGVALHRERDGHAARRSASRSGCCCS